MSQFSGFSEPARLYAENVDVVDLMWKAFTSSIVEFLDALRGEVQRLIEPRQLTVGRGNDGYLYWCIDEKSGAGRLNPRCYCDPTSALIVVPGEISFRAGGTKKDIKDEIRARIVNLREDPELKPHLEDSQGDSWDLIAVRVSYLNAADPVKAVAPVLTALLLKVTAASEVARSDPVKGAPP